MRFSVSWIYGRPVAASENFDRRRGKGVCLALAEEENWKSICRPSPHWIFSHLDRSTTSFRAKKKKTLWRIFLGQFSFQNCVAKRRNVCSKIEFSKVARRNSSKGLSNKKALNIYLFLKMPRLRAIKIFDGCYSTDLFWTFLLCFFQLHKWHPNEPSFIFPPFHSEGDFVRIYTAAAVSNFFLPGHLPFPPTDWRWFGIKNGVERCFPYFRAFKSSSVWMKMRGEKLSISISRGFFF